MVEALIEGRDFEFEDGLMVLTRHYLLARGECCESSCRNCPYGFSIADKEKKRLDNLLPHDRSPDNEG